MVLIGNQIADSAWYVNDEVGAAGWHRTAGSGVVFPRSVFRAALGWVMPGWVVAGVQVFAGDPRDLPPVLSVISGPEHRAVDQPGRRRHLGQDCRVLLAGVVEDPGQELGSFPWRAPGPFLVQECSPLRWGQVLLNEGKHLAFFVRQVIQHDRRKVLGGAVSSPPPRSAVSRPARAGGICWCSITIASTAARSAGSGSSRRSTGRRSSSSAEWWLPSCARKAFQPASTVVAAGSCRGARRPRSAGTDRGAARRAGRG
jgi:hypothetical protein